MPTEPTNQNVIANEIDRLKKLLALASDVEREIKILQEQGKRLQIDAHAFADKNNMVRILRHISEH